MRKRYINGFLFFMAIAVLSFLLFLSACNYNKHDHVFSEWHITENGGCENQSQRTRECYECHYIEVEINPSEGHNIVGQKCLRCGMDLIGSEGLIYESDSEDGLKVVGYSGGEERIIIPSEHNGKRVGAIAEAAFKNNTVVKSILIAGDNPDFYVANEAFLNCTALRFVSFSESISKIASDAFNGCSELSIISVSENNTEFCSVDGVLFNAEKTKILRFPQKNLSTEYVIPNTVKEIGDHSFMDCLNLINLTVPDSVTDIRQNAFKNCSMLASLSIGKGIGSIKNGAFNNCIRINRIDYFGELSDWCRIEFENCDSNPMPYDRCEFYFNGQSVEDLIIPESVDKINPYAFYCFRQIKTITFHDNVTKIGNSAFAFCSLDTIEIGNGVDLIDDGAFYGCNLAEIKFGNSVKYIGENAIISPDLIVDYNGDIADWCEITFENEIASNLYLYINNTKVTDLDIPDTVTEIKEYAFFGCRNLNSVIIGDNVTRIGEFAFLNCSSIVSLTIGKKVDYIDRNAFNSKKLMELYNKSSLTISSKTEEGSILIRAQNIYMEPFDSKLSVTEDGFILYRDDADIILIGYSGEEKDLVLPDEITKLGADCFYKNTNIRSLVLGNNVREIGMNACAYCDRLNTVGISDGVKTIESGAFKGCSRLLSLIIPDSVMVIGYDSFNDCTSLKSVVIGNGLKKVYGFKNCRSLKNITFGSGLKTIGYEAFYGCYLLQSIDIPDTVERIEASAFSKCYSLVSVRVGKAVNHIDSNVFEYCYKLMEVYDETEIEMSKQSKSSWKRLFNDAANVFATVENSKLEIDSDGYIKYRDNDQVWLVGYAGEKTDLIIPSDVTAIYRYAFYLRYDLWSVQIPKSVRIIGESAFQDCSKMDDIIYLGSKNQWETISKGTDWKYGFWGRIQCVE